MKNTNAWPPSGRDFQVYRLLYVEQCSTREVAEAVRLSQTRVCQIADKVAQYVLTVAPAKENQQREQQLVVAEQVASLRVNFLYGAAMQGWHDSQGSQTSTRKALSVTQPPTTVETTRKSPGEGRYLLLAARLALLASRLPLACLEFLEDAEGGEADDTHDANDTPVTSPKVDCSAISATIVSDNDFAADKSIVSRFIDEGCESDVNGPAKARCEFFAPVQPTQTMVVGEDVLSIATATQSPPLSRQQRRARKKLLERKLGRG